MKAYVHYVTSSGAATATDQLAGTAVEFAGLSGRVRAYAASTLTTTTFELKGSTTGKTVIPSGSHANLIGPITAQSGGWPNMIFEGVVAKGEKLDLTVVQAGTETWAVAVVLD